MLDHADWILNGMLLYTNLLIEPCVIRVNRARPRADTVPINHTPSLCRTATCPTKIGLGTSDESATSLRKSRKQRGWDRAPGR